MPGVRTSDGWLDTKPGSLMCGRWAGVKGGRDGQVLITNIDLMMCSRNMPWWPTSAHLIQHCSSDELPITHKTTNIMQRGENNKIIICVTQPPLQSQLRQKQYFLLFACVVSRSGAQQFCKKLANTANKHKHVWGSECPCGLWDINLSCNSGFYWTLNAICQILQWFLL